MGHLISFAGFILTTFELRALSLSLQGFFDGSCLSQVCDAAFLFLLPVSVFLICLSSGGLDSSECFVLLPDSVIIRFGLGGLDSSLNGWRRVLWQIWSVRLS